MLSRSILFAALLAAIPARADGHSFFDAVKAGTPYLTFNTRYEGVDQDNGLEDASALTLLTRFGFKTAEVNGVSALVEFEDSRILFDVDDFSVPPTGFNSGEFSVIADPETTELDQAYIQYVGEGLKARIGRQIIIYDSQRFVGAVPWRQDWQTYDAVHFEYTGVEKLTLKAGHIFARNRIFAEQRDLNSNDTLFDATYDTPYGKLGAYAYLLEVDDIGRNGLDTLGARFKGSYAIPDASPSGINKVHYKLELATQDVETATGDFTTRYLAAEAGVGIKAVTIKAGIERLGSDGGSVGFATPLATLHKFNGWADLFLATPAAGLEDVYASVAGKADKFKWVFIYHDYSSDVRTASGSDLGSELNFQLTRPIGERTTFGFKWAQYDPGDPGFGLVETNRIWSWLTVKF
ncbi:MAG: alginate export family protein [Pseudomonadota bacterium]